MALTGVSTTSIDWSEHTREHVLENTDVSPVAYQASRPIMANLVEFPFVFDSGANCHISPEWADFKDLKPIPPIPVKGFGGSSVQAVGMGAIDVIIASGLRLSLTNVLFVPNADIRLLSVSTLNHENGYTTCFNDAKCWVVNRSGATVMRGTLTRRNLYTVNLLRVVVTRIAKSQL